MEEKLIQYRTAKLAKEKEFSIKSNWWFDDDSFIIRAYEIDELNVKNPISAPTQSLLQKWLREKHNISVFAKNVGYAYDWDMVGVDSFEIDFDKIQYGLDYYKTFEEALEAGLQETIKYLLKL